MFIGIVNVFSVSLQPKVRCDPCPLTHGDEVKMGETVLSFHIHTGTDTCDGCEPGQIIAHLSRHKRDETSGMHSHIDRNNFFCYLIHIFELLYCESVAAYILLQYM